MSADSRTSKIVSEALESLGLSSFEELFLEPTAEVQKYLGEQISTNSFAVSARQKELVKPFDIEEGAPFFLGGGCYDHLVPMAVERMVNRDDLYTAYSSIHAESRTPILQALIDYRETVARLTGMSCVNASVYLGDGVLARACQLAAETTGRGVVLTSAAINPDQLALLRAYSDAGFFELRVVQERAGTTDVEALAKSIEESKEDIAAFVLQYPNFYGALEKMTHIMRLTKSVGAITIASVDLFALAMLKSPNDWGVDIVAGDGAPHGSPNGFECRLGFLAVSERLTRLIPTRILRKVYDRDGNAALGFSLQTSAEPIAPDRRPLITRTRALTDAAISLMYFARVEFETIQKAAAESFKVAKYAREAFKRAGFEFYCSAPTLFEFGVKVDDPKGMNKYLRKWGVVGGYELDDALLLAFTEKRSALEIDELIYFMKAYQFGKLENTNDNL